ncbi:MAG: hypothetical protein DMF17_09265 [Verrucomicrobia bacterium]|nr:MAG: hypothetical protein DMF17_09265 [Verrucomicrobiota bacterium]
MSLPKLTKDQVQKLAFSAIGFVFLLYVYFTFFLGPLNRSRAAMLVTIRDLQSKLDESKDEMKKAVSLEKQAITATSHFAALKALSPEGAPIAWFPPRLKTFFAQQQIDKAVAHLENSTAFKEAELSGWTKYNWLIDLPQADFASVGTAIAELENTEPLLSITRLHIQTLANQPQFQHVELAAASIIEKR